MLESFKMQQNHGTSSNTALSANMLAVPYWTTHGLLRSFLLSVCSVGPTPVHECPHSESLLSDRQSGSMRKTKTQSHDLYGSRADAGGYLEKSAQLLHEAVCESLWIHLCLLRQEAPSGDAS